MGLQIGRLGYSRSYTFLNVLAQMFLLSWSSYSALSF